MDDSYLDEHGEIEDVSLGSCDSVHTHDLVCYIKINSTMGGATMDIKEAYGNVLIDLAKRVKSNEAAAENSGHSAFQMLATGRANAFEQALAIVKHHMDGVIKEEVKSG